jgi:hypothetical protein
MTCYADALPFLRNSLAGTLVFAGAFFGLHAMLHPKAEAKAQAAYT